MNRRAPGALHPTPAVSGHNQGGIMRPLFERLVRPGYHYARYLASCAADRRLGIVTADERLEQDPDNSPAPYRGLPGGYHRAVSFTAIRRLMRALDPGPGDVLLDLGCGAGRVVCIAAQHPFARVIGVENAPRIFALAERNARRLRHCAVRPEVIHADAATYRVPDETTIVFMYNALSGEVLHAALTRVLDSHDRAPRHMRLAYANPREHDLVMQMGRFRETGRMRMSWRPGAEWARTQTINFYEVEPDRR
jgi:SAM-dependent methyltransferase